MDWIEALTLGIVQGVTEFLPVSSDGHLKITQEAFGWWTGKPRVGADDLFFDVMLHVGTVAAILIRFQAVIRTGAKGLLGSKTVPPEYRRTGVVRVGLLVTVATAPLVPYALVFKKLIEKAFEGLVPTGLGFFATAVVLLVTLRLARPDEGGKGPGETTWVDALLIGLAQLLAPLPGVSRSGLTVAVALTRGMSRSWAVGFSLLLAVPAIMGATVFELRHVRPSMLTADQLTRTVAAAAVAGVIGYGAILWLIKVVRAGHLWYFSVYLIVLTLIVLALAVSSASKGSTHARPSQALDRTLRLGAAGPRVAECPARARQPLDRPHAISTRAGRSRTGQTAPRHVCAARLVLGRPLARGS